MKRFLIALLILSTGNAAAQLTCRTQQAIKNNGQTLSAIPFAQVTICQNLALGTPCSPLVPANQLFQNAAGTIPVLGNPVLADVNGNYSWCAAAGTYVEQVGAGGVVTYTNNNVTLGTSSTAPPPPATVPNCIAAGTTQALGVELSTQTIGSVTSLCATTAALSSQAVVGVCTVGCGNSGAAQITYSGYADVIYDNQTVPHDYAIPSSTAAGQFHDVVVKPSGTVELLGLVNIANSGIGTISNTFVSPLSLLAPGTVSGSGNVNNGTIGQLGYYVATGNTIAGDACTTDGNGHPVCASFGTNSAGAGVLGLGLGTPPANPSTGNIRLYGDSGSGSLGCLTSTGSNCIPTNGGGLWIDFCSLAGGGVCDDSTDDTTAFNTALSTVLSAGGGTIIAAKPGKTPKIAGQITIPNGGATQFRTVPIRLTGWGNGPMASSAMAGGVIPNGGSKIDLQFNAPFGKILALGGGGSLEIDHLALIDNSSDCAAFVFITNTTSHIHDNQFFGTASAGSACNDVIVLGGTSTTIDGSTSSPFQGYGTVIRDNFANQVKRFIVGQTFANGVVVEGNTVWANSGNTTGGAIEFAGVVTNSDTGNYIAGNLIEVTNYKYGINFTNYAISNQVISNGCFDQTVTTTACVNFATNADFNFVLAGWSVDTPITYMTDTDGSNTLITSHQNQTSIFPQIVKPHLIQMSAATSLGQAYDLTLSSTGDDVFQSLSTSAGQPTWQLQQKPNGGSNENIITVIRSAASEQFNLGNGANTGLFINPQSTTADLKLRTGGTGQVVWLCGGNQVCDTWADNSGALNNIALVQGKRYSVTKATSLVSGDFALSAGWGTTASSSFPVTTSRDGAFVILVSSSGTGQAANPTLTLTFHDGTWNNLPVCRLTQSGGNDIFASSLPVTSRSATVYTWQFTGTPTAGKNYEFTGDCWGT